MGGRMLEKGKDVTIMEREKKAKGIKVGERKQLQLKARQRKPKKGTCYKASQKACSPGCWVGYSFSY